jgi:hypothetical protein
VPKTEEIDLKSLVITEEEIIKLTGLKAPDLSGEITDFNLGKPVVRMGFLKNSTKKQKLLNTLYQDEVSKLDATLEEQKPIKPKQGKVGIYLIGIILFFIITPILFYYLEWISIFVGILVSFLAPLVHYLMNRYIPFYGLTHKRNIKNYQNELLRWEENKKIEHSNVQKKIINFKNNLNNLEATRLGILLDNINTYNQAVEKAISLISISDMLLEAGNPKTISDQDRKEMLDTYKTLRADLICAVKTDKIWRENPHVRPEDFTISATSTAVRYELSAQAKKYQELVNEAFRIAATVQEQMETVHSSSPKPKKAQNNEILKLKERALLCANLEQGNLGAIDIAKIGAIWAKLAPLNSRFPRVIAAIEQRWQNALTIAPQKPLARLFNSKAVSIRRHLCVEMEVLAEIPSPKEEVEIRLKMVESHIKCLADAVLDKENLLENHYPISKAQEVEKHWYIAPAAPEPIASQLEQRFQIALQTFYSKR